MPFEEGSSSAKGAPAELLDAVLKQVQQSLQCANKIGRKPGQMTMEAVAAIVSRLRVEEMQDIRRATKELENSFDIALAVLAPQTHWPNKMMLYPFLRKVLRRVERLTAAGELQAGAQAINEALVQIGNQMGEASGPQERLMSKELDRQRQQLLLAAMRQYSLLREPEAVASAALAHGATFCSKRPAWSEEYSARLQLLHEEGVADDINFVLRVASIMARHRIRTARTYAEQGSAFMELARPLMVLADREPSEAASNEARQALMRAREGFAKARRFHEQEQASNYIAAIDEQRMHSGPGVAGHSDHAVRRVPDFVDPQITKIIADLHAQDRIGAGPHQVPLACAQALLQALSQHELAEPALAMNEMTFALSAAIGLLQHRDTDSPDPVYRAALQKVAQLTAEGQLRHSAEVIDEAITQGRADAMRTGSFDRLRSLLAVSMRQAELLRDAVRGTEARLELLELDDSELYAASPEFTEQIDSLYRLGASKGYAFALKLAIAMAWTSCAMARTASEECNALLQVGYAESELGKLQGGLIRLYEAARVYRQAAAGVDRSRDPRIWAVAQNNLGNVLSTLAAMEEDIDLLFEASWAFSAALSELPQATEDGTLTCSSIQHRLGRVLMLAGQRSDDTKLLEKALEAFRVARDTCPQDQPIPTPAAIAADLAAVQAEIDKRRDASRAHARSH